MSEFKKKVLVEQESIKSIAREMAETLLASDTVFTSKMITEANALIKTKILSLMKSYLRQERKKLINTKKIYEKEHRDIELIRQQIQKIDINMELVTQYIQTVLEKQSKNLNDELKYLYELKVTYDRVFQQARRNYRVLEKLIELNYEQNNLQFLPDLLNALVEVGNDKAANLKMINYIEKMLRLQTKERNLLANQAKRLASSPFDIEDIEDEFIPSEPDEMEDVEEIYLDKISELRNIDEVILLLNNYPELFELKDFNKNYVLENILDKYFNIIINRNLENVEALEAKEYLDRLLKAYINYGAKSGNDFYNIIQAKMNHVYSIVEKNNFDGNKEKEILICLTKLSDLLHYYQNLNTPKKEKKKHEFEQEKMIITIDNEKAKIFEDAISVEKSDSSYRLTLYISDVASFVIRNSLQDIEAKCEFMSTDNNMFPKAYYKRFSLDQGRNRYAYAYIFDLTHSMDVKEFNVKKVKLRVNQNFDFKQAEEALNNTKHKYHETMHLLNKISKEMVNEKIVSINKHGILTPSDMIEIQVCFAKNFIAKYCSDNHLPLVLQNRGLNYGVKESELLGLPLEERVYNATEKRDLAPTGEFTSPARSYISLFNQRLHNRYFISKKEITPTELVLLGEETNDFCNTVNQEKYGYQKIK